MNSSKSLYLISNNAITKVFEATNPDFSASDFYFTLVILKDLSCACWYSSYLKYNPKYKAFNWIT